MQWKAWDWNEHRAVAVARREKVKLIIAAFSFEMVKTVQVLQESEGDDEYEYDSTKSKWEAFRKSDRSQARPRKPRTSKAANMETRSTNVSSPKEAQKNR